MGIFELLTQIYPRYMDSASHNAARKVGMTLIEKDEVDRKMGVT